MKQLLQILSVISLTVSTSFAALTVELRDEGLTDTKWAKPRIFIKNSGTTPETVNSVRYYFTKTSGKTPVLELWDPSNLQANIMNIALDTPYVEINMGAIVLAPGEAYRWGNGILFGLHNSDWSNWNKAATPRVVVNSLGTPSYPGNQFPGNSVDLSMGSDCWQEFSVVAKTIVNAGDRAKVSGSVIAGGAITINADADIENGSLFTQSSITLKDRAWVQKDAYAKGAISLINGAVVQGIKQSYASTVATCPINMPSIVYQGGPAISVNNYSTMTLSPGTYSDIDVGYGATLILTPGYYVFDNFIIRADARINLVAGNNPTRVGVTNYFEFGDRSQVTMDGPDVARRFQLYSVAYQVKSIIGYDTKIQGTIAAPNSEILLKSRANLVGSIVADIVTIEADASIQWAPKLSIANLPPTVLINTLHLGQNIEAVITAFYLKILDTDTPIEQLSVKVLELPKRGIIYKNGVALNVDGTFTPTDIAQNKITYKQTTAGYTQDIIVLEISDGVSTVRTAFSIYLKTN